MTFEDKIFQVNWNEKNTGDMMMVRVVKQGIVSMFVLMIDVIDFSDEEIDQEKIISERLNKTPNLENTNHKLFLDENNTFKYDNPICPVCGSHKIIKKGTITKNKQNINGNITEFREQQYQCKECNKKFGINNNPLIDNNKQFLISRNKFK